MSGFKRSLGLVDAVMIVAGSMIGSGIFIVSAEMLRNLGSPAWMLTAWVVAGVLTIMAALSYGELSGMMPKAGGQYIYIQRAFGKLPAFMYGWTVFTVIQTGVIAAVAVAFAKFTAVFFPALSVDNILFSAGPLKVSAAQVFAIASILFLTWFNSRGVREATWLQTIFTSAKIIALLALIVLGLFAAGRTGLLEMNMNIGWEAFSTAFSASGEPTISPLSGIAMLSALGLAMVGSLFSSDAWNNVTFIAGEIKEPQRNLPLSLFFGTLIVTVLYVLANVVYLALLPADGIMMAPMDRVGTAAAGVLFGEGAVYIMAALIMVSTFGCNNGCILGGSRLFYAMAQDGLFFRKAGILNAASVPGFALWIQCAWACVLCLSGTYGTLLNYVTFASLLFYIVTIAGLFRLRATEPDAPRPYKAFGYPWIPALYILCASLFCLNLLFRTPVEAGAGLGIVALGALVYWIQGRMRANNPAADQ